MLLGLAVSAQGVGAALDLVCLKGNMEMMEIAAFGARSDSSESSEINIKVGMVLLDPTLPSEDTSSSK